MMMLLFLNINYFFIRMRHNNKTSFQFTTKKTTYLNASHTQSYTNAHTTYTSYIYFKKNTHLYIRKNILQLKHQIWQSVKASTYSTMMFLSQD